jgi:hypothetical protein
MAEPFRRGAALITITIEGRTLRVYRGREETPLAEVTGRDWRSELRLWDAIEAAVRQARLRNELRIHDRQNPTRKRSLRSRGSSVD